MLSDDTLATLDNCAADCDAARSDLESTLARAERADTDDARAEALKAAADALQDWQNAQQQFMDTVAASNVSDIAMATLLLKNKTGTDAMNARRGLPGASVDGTDQPLDLDLSGMRGSLLMEAVTTHLEA